MGKLGNVIFVRHGQTEWSENGRHTGVTELPLTRKGAYLVAAEGRVQVGEGRAIDTRHVAKVFVSPRRRAQQTMDLLLAEHKWDIDPADVHIDERIAEWNYGDFEGLTTAQINAKIGHKFDIWTEGCEGGESPADVTARVDALIADIRKVQAAAAAADSDKGDVLVFGHGHILRAFVTRWVGVKVNEYHPIILPAGGIGVVTYEHNSLDEPALLLGGAFNLSH